MAEIDWNFAAHDVEFTLTVRAVFDPKVNPAVVSLKWIDGTNVTIGPFSDFSPDEEAPGAQSRRWPGATRAEGKKALARLPVTLDLVRRIQSSRLPIVVYPDGCEAEEPKAKSKAKPDEPKAKAREPVAGRARVHLGPLLLASDADEARQEGGSRKAQPCTVAAIATETIGLAGLYSLALSVSVNVPVLTRPMLERLLPATFTVDAVKGLQAEACFPDLYKDVSVQVYPAVNNETECLERELRRYCSCTCPCTCQGKCTCACTCTGSQPHNTVVRFNEPVTWLLGLAPLHAVREWMQHQGLVVEIHDHDSRVVPYSEDAELPAEGEGEAEEGKKHVVKSAVLHPHGVAHFALAPLLESRSLVLPLRADVCPRRGNKKLRLAELMTETPSAVGLLEEEGQKRLARRAVEGKLEETTNYHRETTCTLRAVLALPIPSAADIQAVDEAGEHARWAAAEQEDGGGSGIWTVLPALGAGGNPGPWAPQPYRAKLAGLPAAEGADAARGLPGPWRRQRAEAEEDLKRLTERLGPEAPDVQAAQVYTAELAKQPLVGLHRRKEKYGRAVLVFRDEDTVNIRRVLTQVRQQNARVLGVASEVAALATYEFSEGERADPHLDILTGFTMLDGQVRLMVIEGLRDQGMAELFKKAVLRNDQPNSATYKLLYHPNIGFGERLYLDFGPILKTIKIRQPLSPIERLASKAELYASSGNTDEVTVAGKEAPKMILDLMRMDRQRSMRLGASFPKADNLNSLESLFGGYLSDEEIEGLPYLTEEEMAARGAPAKNRKSLTNARATSTMTSDELQQLLEPHLVEADGMNGTKHKPKLRGDTVNKNDDFESTLRMRASASAPNFLQTNRISVAERSQENARVNDIFGKKRIRETPFLDGKEVFLYSSQKLNSAELQKDWMRAAMDPQQQERVWTYNESYTSAGFEFSGAAPPGVRDIQPSCPDDTYSRVPGDTRQVWRATPARPKEDFRKPERDIGHARGEVLKEGFRENEWKKLPYCEERHKPIATATRFEPDKVPHHKLISERPFDKSKILTESKEFGPKSYFESVNYHAHGSAGTGRNSDTVSFNEQEMEREKLQDREASALVPKFPASDHRSALGRRQAMTRSFSHGTTRTGVTDLDRHEQTFKDPRIVSRTQPMAGPPSIYLMEEFHERGRPDKEFQVRMRENDDTPAYDVVTGTYMPRDPEIGHRRACMSGTLGKAPWRHGALGETTVVPHGGLPGSTQVLQRVEYGSKYDFNLTRPPPRSKICENQVWKNASRTNIVEDERKHVAYKRPKDYGVRIEQAG